MTDMKPLMALLAKRNENELRFIFGFGAAVQDMLRRREYKSIVKAGMDIASRLADCGYSMSIREIYVCHATAAWSGEMQKELLDTECPYQLIPHLTACKMEGVQKTIADARSGTCTWKGYAAKLERRKIHKPQRKVMQNHTVPMAQRVSGIYTRAQTSQLNPPLSVNVEDDDAVVFGLLNLMTRRHMMIVRDWNKAAERYNKGKNAEYCLPLLKTPQDAL